MLISILCTFRPGAYSKAKEMRLEHYEFIRAQKSTIVEGGPLLGPDGVPSAMLIVIDRPKAADARSFIENEPYTANGLFESVEIREWRRVIPEPVPDFVENEYKKELAARRD